MLFADPEAGPVTTHSSQRCCRVIARQVGFSHCLGSKGWLYCRAEVVDGQVQVVGPSAAGQAAEGSPNQEPAKEDFEVPSQLRQQFIEVVMCSFAASRCLPRQTSLINLTLVWLTSYCRNLYHSHMLATGMQDLTSWFSLSPCHIGIRYVMIGPFGIVRE